MPRICSSISLVCPPILHKAEVLTCIGQELKQKSISTFTDILNAVAPPISEHEVIQVWLGHDMHGYDGVESLVYRAMAKVLMAG